MASHQDTTTPAFSETELAAADALGTQLIRFVKVMHRARARFVKANPSASIEQPAFAILATLITEGPQRTSALAEYLHTEISTISRQTSSLVQHGLIERQADPDDGRACLLAPTEKGRRVFDQARDVRNRWLATTVREWSLTDRELLISLLERLNADLGKRDLETDNKGAHA